jgi:uncharacterized phage-associated protein
MCTASDIAKYFIFKSNKENRPITNKKLQKLLYYGQAWALVLLDGKKLFNDKIEAWIHGPAIRSIYGKYKPFGFNDIVIDIDENELKIKGKNKEILDAVWKVYGKYDANYLEILTHNELPWQKGREGLDNTDSSSNEINLKIMKEYYSKLLKNNN